MDGPASRPKFVLGIVFPGASRWPPQIVIRYACMIATGELQLGPLRLRAPTSWKFTPLGGMILARTDARLGTMQITLAFASNVARGADHAACLVQLRQFMQEPTEQEIYVEKSDQADAVFGHVTVHNASLFRRYWYRFKENGLILALYQCKADQFAAARTEIDEAGTIAATLELCAPK